MNNDVLLSFGLFSAQSASSFSRYAPHNSFSQLHFDLENSLEIQQSEFIEPPFNGEGLFFFLHMIIDAELGWRHAKLLDEESVEMRA